ncbi:sugar ABC transporter ATP-binding protein [Treponema sp. OMZ 840]|uniref:sugar ABC transporter ATP-binding protein n=1 Tax=Treponema sp. OMZ 840 TaxID=244313 RepID=UPI003D90A980
MDEIFLKVHEVSKNFVGVPALHKVSFTLKKGSVHALCGENGAGKSTLMNILMGSLLRDSGEIFLHGKPISFTSPKQALAAGISIIEQELSPIPEMSIAENIFLGREPKKIGLFIDYNYLNKHAKVILGQMGVDIDPKVKMKHLKIAQIQLVEIAKALSYNSDILIMDEPTSALGEKEVDKLFEVIQKIKDRGKSVIYISHRLQEVFTIADEITVLRDGKWIGSGKKSEFNKMQLINMMIGRELEGEYVKKNIPQEETALEVSHLSRKKEFENINFNVKKGEIVGVFGLMGSGRSELFDSLFGVTRYSQGKIYLHGKQIHIAKPKDAVLAGLAYITEDRKKSGLVLNRSVADNITISSLKRFTKFGLINSKDERTAVSMLIEEFQIKAFSAGQLVKTLSGGNQQKVVFGRWVLTNPKILLLDEPTRGIDVGAKREIYKFMSSYASQGNSIIMISSELPEILGMSDRVIVFKEGQVSGILQRKEANQEKLMCLAT